ncbi:MAG TPA: cytochrome c [bacterium]
MAMKQWKTALAAAVIALALAGGAPAAETSLKVSAAEVARGEVVFRENCQVCHGEKARGQDPAKPMGGQQAGGAYLAPALNGTGHTQHHKPDVLFGYLRNGSPDKASPMRSFKDKLSEADIKAVLGYVYSLWPEDVKQMYSHHMHH